MAGLLRVPDSFDAVLMKNGVTLLNKTGEGRAEFDRQNPVTYRTYAAWMAHAGFAVSIAERSGCWRQGYAEVGGDSQGHARPRMQPGAA